MVPEGWLGNPRNLIVAKTGNGAWGGVLGTSGPLYLALQNYAPYELGQATVSQVISGLTPNGHYQLRFDCAERNGFGEQELASVSVNGITVLNLINPPANDFAPVRSRFDAHYQH